MQLYESINSQWEHALSLTHASELHAMLVEQQALSRTLLESKEKLLAELQGELKGKDDEYVRDLRAQAEDVDTMMSFMEEEVKRVAREYRRELENVEISFMTERQELVEAARKEWEKMMGKRREMEEKHTQLQLELIAEREDQVSTLRE